MDEDIVVEEGNGLGEDQVVMIEGGGDDPVIEDEIGQNVDEKDFSLSDGEAEEVDGDFIGRGVED